MEMVREIGPASGSPNADVDVLVAMVEHHLLLPDVAMRRDLTDPATISQVAEAVGAQETLDLLHALTDRRLEGDRPVGVGIVEGGARRDLVSPRPSRARRRRRRRGHLAPVPRCRDPREDGHGRHVT
jgi:hypothetical protein